MVEISQETRIEKLEKKLENVNLAPVKTITKIGKKVTDMVLNSDEAKIQALKVLTNKTVRIAIISAIVTIAIAVVQLFV